MKQLLKVSNTFTWVHNNVLGSGEVHLKVTLLGSLNSKDEVIDMGKFISIVEDNLLKDIDKLNVELCKDNELYFKTLDKYIYWIWGKLVEPLKGDNYELFQLELEEPFGLVYLGRSTYTLDKYMVEERID